MTPGLQLILPYLLQNTTKQYHHIFRYTLKNILIIRCSEPKRSHKRDFFLKDFYNKILPKCTNLNPVDHNQESGRTKCYIVNKKRFRITAAVSSATNRICLLRKRIQNLPKNCSVVYQTECTQIRIRFNIICLCNQFWLIRLFVLYTRHTNTDTIKFDIRFQFQISQW